MTPATALRRLGVHHLPRRGISRRSAHAPPITSLDALPIVDKGLFVPGREQCHRPRPARARAAGGAALRLSRLRGWSATRPLRAYAVRDWSTRDGVEPRAGGTRPGTRRRYSRRSSGRSESLWDCRRTPAHAVHLPGLRTPGNAARSRSGSSGSAGRRARPPDPSCSSTRTAAAPRRGLSSRAPEIAAWPQRAHPQATADVGQAVFGRGGALPLSADAPRSTACTA